VHGGVGRSPGDRAESGRDSAQQQQCAILVNAFEVKSVSNLWFFHELGRSPILRIVVFAALLPATAACDRLGLGSSSPTAPTGVPTAGSTINYSAVGASDANGVGSSVPCISFTDCPNGMGYVPVATRQLRSQGFTVNLLNLGIPTAVIGRDFETLGQQYNRTILGNFIEQEVPFVQPNATVVTIFAGLNEINTITAALGAGAGGADPNGFIDAQVRAFSADVTTVLNGIASRAGAPRLVILNVPNPAGMPYLAGVSLAQRQAAQRAAVAMTRTVVNPLVASNRAIIDLMCDGRSYQASTYSSDGLHPSDAGYAFIAAEVVRAVTTSSYPAPQASCASMAIVP
jgi:lysophospholipase L1-like esterase